MNAKTNVWFRLMVLLLTGTAVMESCSLSQQHSPDKKMKNQTGKTITVTGTADHSKACAIVVSGENVYFIEGKQDWGALYGKKVKVTGTLKTVTTTAEDLRNEKGEIMQGIEGSTQYIADAKIEEVK